MKRLIIFTIFLSTSRLELFAQEILAEEIYKYAVDNIFEDYRQGFNDSSSIGYLKYLFIDDSIKFKYIERNPDLRELNVTGTAAPFEKRIPFDEWINQLYVEQDINHIFTYRLEERTDGMVYEVLTIEQNAAFKTGENYYYRNIWIYRLNKTIISIWDSDLN